MTYRIMPDDEPVGVDLHVDGSRLVSVDVYADGSRGVLRHDLGEHKSPEHAEAMLLLMNRVDFFLIASTITEEQIDNLAAAILELKQRKAQESEAR